MNREINNRKKNYPSPVRITPFPDIENFTVSEGENHTLVLIIQIMLESLRLYYDLFGFVPLSGNYDSNTVSAVNEFQRAIGVEQTGRVDIITWNALADEYNAVGWDRHQ